MNRILEIIKEDLREFLGLLSVEEIMANMRAIESLLGLKTALGEWG